MSFPATMETFSSSERTQSSGFHSISILQRKSTRPLLYCVSPFLSIEVRGNRDAVDLTVANKEIYCW